MCVSKCFSVHEVGSNNLKNFQAEMELEVFATDFYALFRCYICTLLLQMLFFLSDKISVNFIWR